MAMTLFVKSLLKRPIGAHVELTIENGASLEKVEGVITDNDYTTSVEITTLDGSERIIDYSTIKGFKETKTLDDVLKELSKGTSVKFSYGDEKEPNLTGTVGENDGEEAIEIRTSSGEDLVLHYSLIRSLVVISSHKLAPKPGSPAPDPKPPKPLPIFVAESKKDPLYKQTPEDILNHSDIELQKYFDEILYKDRKKLNGIFDSFKYGVKDDNQEKKVVAAQKARAILFSEADQNYDWSEEAVLFVGYLLRRVNIYDPEVFLVAECFEEAAYAAWKASKYALAGAYAITALLENTDDVENMVIILASSVVKGDDVSGLRIFSERLPDGMEPQLLTIISEAFSAKGFQLSAGQDVTVAMESLAKLYPNTTMGEEVEYWLPNEDGIPESITPEQKEEKPTNPVASKIYYGVISRLNWSDQTGTIIDDDDATYTFRYGDITDTALLKEIRACLRADLGGKVYTVSFVAENHFAKNIETDTTLVQRAQKIVSDKKSPDSYAKAFKMCKRALGTTDHYYALYNMLFYANPLFEATKASVYAEEAIESFEKNMGMYAKNPQALMNAAQCYSHLGNYTQMQNYAEKAMNHPDLPVEKKKFLASQYLKVLREYYDVSDDKALLSRMIEIANQLWNDYRGDFNQNPSLTKAYNYVILPHKIFAECGLDMQKEAEADYARIPADYDEKATLDKWMDELRERMTPKKTEVAPSQSVDLAERTEDVPDDAPKAEEGTIYLDEANDEEEAEEEIRPYVDTDGWDALKLTKREVVDYALRITGPDRIPAILAYLRAGASLNDEIAPAYHTVALAANDPMEAPDYSITALSAALAAGDADYPSLNDLCMGAAFLRSSFLSGRGYDYSAQGLRDSISISQQIPALRNAYDTLEQFRSETGRAIDIYADYRNQDVKKLNADMDSAVRHADELYTKYILTHPRENANFARILETRKILFSSEGYLAIMLKHIMERDQEALETEKANFVATYLNGADQFPATRISVNAVDALVAESWDQAGRNMQMKKNNSILQGDRRNNLRSNVSEIITAICQWYALSEQSAGLTWRKEHGEAAYQRLRPQLMEQLSEISEDCQAELESCSDPELCTGLFLLASTAKELSARLDGTWKLGQEKYLYVDFLRSNNIMLGSDFMPELESTFCVLQEFNVMARIRKHVEGSKNSFQEQINQIYGKDKMDNNYGTAMRILAYAEACDSTEPVVLPPEPEQYVAQTELQIDLRYRNFRETYALAMSYGQIIKSDAFCHTLEDTVKYWYAFCKETKNYGFFTSILQQAENQIHASARQYETQLDEQLDALIVSNQQYFDEHPDYAEAIRAQIANQNFTVAEDWMARIRIGDFSLDVQQSEALAYLERLWNNYVVTYKHVADAGRTLSALWDRRDVRNRNKDTKRGQRLIDNWLNSGNPSNSERISTLLNLLGWQNIRVSQYQFAGEPRAEIYEVRKESSAAGLTTPLHPIAAFGSSLEKKRMYVVCLYGIYDCERLYEKMCTMDAIDGSKIFLLDYALGQTDRRELARKLKKRESGLRNVNMVIDRVLITHLADNYNENLINRILMATAIPFSYCQPYVVESIHLMPPEIFIGRKDELLKIEQADGVNLIYGGRQLGKSALFKKARADIDGRQNQRAILVDIKDLDCASAAKRLSEELIDLNITPGAEITEDWDVLCRNIKRRLRNEEDEISYFLLMLDEADDFIKDCANNKYAPLTLLKDVQQSFPGRFKYVLAGLHDIVKFYRQVALGNNSVITHMSHLKITPFRTEEAEELLIKPLSYLGFSLPSKVTVSQIIATCNYFPGLIQLYAQKLIESVRARDYAGYDIRNTPPYIVSDVHLRRIMAEQEFVDQLHEKFEITLELDQYYTPLALLIGWMYNVMPSKSGYTAKDVLYHAKDLSIKPLADLDEDKIDGLLQELQDLNILRSVSNNSYVLASKNFRDLLGSDEEIFEKLMNFGGVAV